MKNRDILLRFGIYGVDNRTPPGKRLGGISRRNPECPPGAVLSALVTAICRHGKNRFLGDAIYSGKLPKRRYMHWYILGKITVPRGHGLMKPRFIWSEGTATYSCNNFKLFQKNILTLCKNMIKLRNIFHYLHNEGETE
jgi:hypothetical protein